LEEEQAGRDQYKATIKPQPQRGKEVLKHPGAERGATKVGKKGRGCRGHEKKNILQMPGLGWKGEGKKMQKPAAGGEAAKKGEEDLGRRMLAPISLSRGQKRREADHEGERLGSIRRPRNVRRTLSAQQGNFLLSRSHQKKK